MQDIAQPDRRRVAVPLSTLLALLHDLDCQDFAAELQLPLNNWLTMEETWEQKEQTDLQAIVARPAALHHCHRRNTSLACLLGLQHTLSEPKWEVMIKVPAGMAGHVTYAKNPIGQSVVVFLCLKRSSARLNRQDLWDTEDLASAEMRCSNVGHPRSLQVAPAQMEPRHAADCTSSRILFSMLMTMPISALTLSA